MYSTVCHVVCMCMCVCVCVRAYVVLLKAANLFLLVLYLREGLKIKLMEANQSRDRQFRLKLLHPTRFSRCAPVCICVVNLLASAVLSVTSVISQSSFPAPYYIQFILAQL